MPSSGATMHVDLCYDSNQCHLLEYQSAGTPMEPNELGHPLGSGREADVYEHGQLALKLYKATASKSCAFREAAILAIVETFALPAPKVSEVGRFGGRWGFVMTRASGPTFAETIASQPALIPAYLDEMVRLHRQVHDQPGTRFP